MPALPLIQPRETQEPDGWSAPDAITNAARRPISPESQSVGITRVTRGGCSSTEPNCCRPLRFSQ